MVLLISYDLNGHERPSSYARVREIIEKNATSWAKPLYSQWFVETTANTQAWSEALRKVMDKDDRLFVSQVVRGGYTGWLDQSVIDWLSTRV